MRPSSAPSGDRADPGPTSPPAALFDVLLNFPIPADLSVLSATQLLLLQFNPRCTTHADVAQAAALFFRRADEAKAAALAPVSHEPKALATLELQRYWVEWEGGERSEAGGLALRVEDGGLTVARADERLFTLEAGHMNSLSCVYEFVETCDFPAN